MGKIVNKTMTPTIISNNEYGSMGWVLIESSIKIDTLQGTRFTKEYPKLSGGNLVQMNMSNLMTIKGFSFIPGNS